ncbi:unnamed protein product [Prorocentrum cordatum]|uniref:Uncharacterized protein n=1 Tax=Prorocentrum cordatum TaxID=2364126 RepID=A0ABN9U9Y0_9DINO|nr:unnamed protein product [Polarella glacialis]
MPVLEGNFHAGSLTLHAENDVAKILGRVSSELDTSHPLGKELIDRVGKHADDAHQIGNRLLKVSTMKCTRRVRKPRGAAAAAISLPDRDEHMPAFDGDAGNGDDGAHRAD